MALAQPDEAVAQNERSRPVGRAEVTQRAIEAAAELFAERSPSQVSVRDIAARAGVSHALVHRYLGTKDEILTAALEYQALISNEYAERIACGGELPSMFERESPTSKYFMMATRAALDGYDVDLSRVPVSPAEGRIGDLALEEFPDSVTPDPDPRVSLACAAALTMAFSVAEDYLLGRAGLLGEDRDWVRSEIDKIQHHMIAVARRRLPR